MVAWISNRNALIATVFGSWRSWPTIAGDVMGTRHRRCGDRVVCCLALLSGEFAISAVGYLVAYACFVDRAPPQRRALSLLPYAAVILSWMVVYLASGAGVQGSGTYLSPLHDLGAFARALPERACTLLGATFGPLSADLALFGYPGYAVPRMVVGGLVVGGALWALRPDFRRGNVARFWLFGTLFAVLPIAASPPGDRLLSFVGIGSAALVANIVKPLVDAELRQRTSRARLLVTSAFGALHLVFAPLLLPLRAAQMQVLGRALEKATTALDQVPALEQRTLVILNAPVDIFASYIQADRAWRGVPRAKRLYWLTSSGSPAEVRRTDARTLVIEREKGFLSTPLEKHYRRGESTMRAGTTVELAQMTATVQTATDDGRPLAVSFRFTEELESSSFVFLIWNGDRYRPFDIGRLTKPVALPAEDPRTNFDGLGHGRSDMTQTNLRCVACEAEGADLALEIARVNSNVRAFRSESFEFWRCRRCLSLHASEEVDLAHYYASYPFFSLPEDGRLRAMYDNQLKRLYRAGVGLDHRILDYGAGGGGSFGTSGREVFARYSGTTDTPAGFATRTVG